VKVLGAKEYVKVFENGRACIFVSGLITCAWFTPDAISTIGVMVGVQGVLELAALWAGRR
jgi:hypothetical protein